MLTSLGTPQQLGHTAIAQASRQNSWLFAIYMVFVIGGAALTFLVWKSGNAVQDAIVADANARIEKAKATAAEADERSKQLEKGNLTLRTDLNGQIGEIARLQTDAANAKAVQQSVETELSKQKERTATAEIALIALQQKVRGRGISDAQRRKFLEVALSGRKGEVAVEAPSGDPEAIEYATQLRKLLTDAGWKVPNGYPPVELIGIRFGAGSIGLSLRIESFKPFVFPPTGPPGSFTLATTSRLFHSILLKKSLDAAKITIDVIDPVHYSEIKEDSVRLVIGHKP